MKKRLIFLGGTIANNPWRYDVIRTLLQNGVLKSEIFNPIVPDWDDAAREREAQAKARATYFLFYIGDPGQKGNPISAYSIAETVVSLYENPRRTLVVFDMKDMEGHPLKAMQGVYDRLKELFPDNIFETLDGAVGWLVEKMGRST